MRQEMTMKALLAGICILTLLPAAGIAAKNAESQPPRVGTLNCNILPHSGINLLIHSTREIQCTFKPEAAGASEYYKGETGIGFGLDVALKRSSSLDYAVFARPFTAGSHPLAGKYEGMGGDATLGVSVGKTSPIQKRDGSIVLQPIGGKNKGAGAAAGYTYLYLQLDEHPPEQSTPGD